MIIVKILFFICLIISFYIIYDILFFIFHKKESMTSMNGLSYDFDFEYDYVDVSNSIYSLIQDVSSDISHINGYFDDISGYLNN